MPEKGASRHISGQIDLNSAEREELARVSDIGERRAEKIVQYRNEHGRFRSVADLKNIEGFDETLVRDLEGSVKV